MLRDSLMYFIRHKGKKILTSVGSDTYEVTVAQLQTQVRDIGRIPPGYEHRPDLISNLYFGSPGLWWTFCEMNAVVDPFEELNVNDEVNLPE